eukprot:GHVP01053685.1.p1 GENE.GHVP01053685.1~~GHVP01053685.1.p1  ORF type:complete len:473 (+),score=92.70 GHVP01053685.1:917-2335(+)
MALHCFSMAKNSDRVSHALVLQAGQEKELKMTLNLLFSFSASSISLGASILQQLLEFSVPLRDPFNILVTEISERPNMTQTFRSFVDQVNQTLQIDMCRMASEFDICEVDETGKDSVQEIAEIEQLLKQASPSKGSKLRRLSTELQSSEFTLIENEIISPRIMGTTNLQFKNFIEPDFFKRFGCKIEALKIDAMSKERSKKLLSREALIQCLKLLASIIHRSSYEKSTDENSPIVVLLEIASNLVFDFPQDPFMHIHAANVVLTVALYEHSTLLEGLLQNEESIFWKNIFIECRLAKILDSTTDAEKRREVRSKFPLRECSVSAIRIGCMLSALRSVYNIENTCPSIFTKNFKSYVLPVSQQKILNLAASSIPRRTGQTSTPLAAEENGGEFTWQTSPERMKVQELLRSPNVLAVVVDDSSLNIDGMPNVKGIIPQPSLAKKIESQKTNEFKDEAPETQNSEFQFATGDPWI